MLIAWYLIGNTNRNLAARHIATGFAFLGRVAGIPIAESLIPYNPSVDTFGRALIIGILNTLQVAVIGIILATILGTLIGIGRLSHNFLLAKLTGIYVETLRDIPLLLQLFFWGIRSCRRCQPPGRPGTSATFFICPTGVPWWPSWSGSRPIRGRC